MGQEYGVDSVQMLGQAIRLARRQTGYSQREVAALCDVSLPFLNSIEAGKPTAQIGKVLAVCARLGITIVVRLPEHDGALS